MKRHRINLEQLARMAMIEHGLQPDLPRDAAAELENLAEPEPSPDVRELTDLSWISIDNHDSRDLDQVVFAERVEANTLRVLIGIADVDAFVRKDSALDRHALANTTSVYVPGRVFAMLPERLSTDLTSLNPGEDRLAVIAEVEVASDGSLRSSSLFRARVRNHAKLVYEEVADWLEKGGPPGKNAKSDDQVRLQDEAARRLRKLRQQEGALDFDTIEAKAEMRDGDVVSVYRQRKTRAHAIIEDLMITANGVTARFLDRKRMSSIRRIVRAPDRWERIVKIAEEHRYSLPPEPDPSALEEFLLIERKKDPIRFPDLSLSIIKLLGRGEYEVQKAGAPPAGHFGLAVRDYTHSTAPNRRYPDLVTQRLVKAAIAGEKSPYTYDELSSIAQHCTRQENAADKVERFATKAAAALHLANRKGEEFEGIVTGASSKGSWVRIFDPPVEGKVVRGDRGLDVGDRIRVELVGTDPERGFIDFERVKG
ncbi:MAG TPA: RNB domain-containing ribonuclease [Thermoanaerobaculia bacterium]|nr:RNB domain-containing ribonuclease [Thermoanaerobaculia bacterium]